MEKINVKNNTLDKQYQALLQDILDNGVEKKDRTTTGTISVFGRQIRHKMSDGFPLLTSKKMAWKTMVIELLWFLRGDTNIKYLVDNNCHIWDGDAYKNYLIEDSKILPNMSKEKMTELGYRLSQEEFINKIKTDDEFAKKWGELGPIYGKQWRSWKSYTYEKTEQTFEDVSIPRAPFGIYGTQPLFSSKSIDQIANLINDLKTNPDSRRLMVNAWNVGEIDQMVLPPCHYGFQVYTRELSDKERMNTLVQNEQRLIYEEVQSFKNVRNKKIKDCLDKRNVPTRAISLMWNQRSVDTFLGLPFNIASYGLLLEIIAKEVNMVPDELIGNLGDVHLYSNHVEQAKEQIGRDYTLEERLNMVSEEIQKEFSSGVVNLPNFPNTPVWSDDGKMSCLDDFGVPRRTREPFELPTITLPSCLQPGSGNWDKLVFEDFYLNNYQSHPTIKAPLSN